MTWKRPNILQRMQVYFENIGSSSISWALDIGTGEGVFAKLITKTFSEASVIQTDLRKFKLVSDNGYLSTIESLPHRSKSLSLIVAAQVLHYLPPSHHQGIISELYRQLEPEGTLIIIEYISNRAYSWLPFPISVDHLQSLSPSPSEIIYDNDERRPKYAARYSKTH